MWIANPLTCTWETQTRRRPNRRRMLPHFPSLMSRIQPMCLQDGYNAMEWSKHSALWFLCTWRREVDGKTCDRNKPSFTNLLRSRENKTDSILLDLSWQKFTTASSFNLLLKFMKTGALPRGIRERVKEPQFGVRTVLECPWPLGLAARVSTLLPHFPPQFEAPGLGEISEEWLCIVWERYSSWYKLFVRRCNHGW